MLKKILVVDDEPDSCEALGDFLGAKGYSVLETHSGDQALGVYRQEDPDVVLLDIRMPGKDGLEVLEGIRQQDADAAVIMLTAVHDMDTVVRAMELGANDYLVKPINREQLVVSLRLAMGSMRLKEGTRIPEDKASLPVVARLRGLTTEAKRALGGSELDISAFPFKIGRMVDSTLSDMLDDNNLYIEDDRPYVVSRNHCAIVYSGKAVSVLDRGSTMGTIVNEENLSRKTKRASSKLTPGVHTLLLGPPSSPYRFSLFIE
ncbi:response regulator [Nitrospinae bacterium AH_259_B05_G02_I21]|nr:response regulator [Nitrospinae bacterium AH_259_B05_G02_I21]